MQSNFFKLVVTLLILTPVSSWAIVEARLTYGSLGSQQDLSTICQGSCPTPSNAPAIVPTFGLGADVIVKLPAIPFGFGLRYEDMKLDASTSTISADLKYQRTSALINYRLIDTILHVGLIGSFGLNHKGSMSISENNTPAVSLSSDSQSSYSVGLEAGIKPLIVLPLVVGAEAGYMSYKWDQATNTIDSTKKDVDLSGTYIKVFLGLDL